VAKPKGAQLRTHFPEGGRSKITEVIRIRAGNLRAESIGLSSLGADPNAVPIANSMA
jgi:hypothetical protein